MLPRADARASEHYALAVAAPSWLVRNYGPRCTLVCAASVLRRLGAANDSLVEVIAAATGFREAYGPPVWAYLGGHSALDRGIERAGSSGGISVRSRTRFVVRWPDLAASLAADIPVVLNCCRAPSRQWSHSVLAVEYALNPRRLLTLDPNDGACRWLTWLRPTTGWICTATFIEPVGPPPALQAPPDAALSLVARAASVQRASGRASRKLGMQPRKTEARP